MVHAIVPPHCLEFRCRYYHVDDQASPGPSPKSRVVIESTIRYAVRYTYDFVRSGEKLAQSDLLTGEMGREHELRETHLLRRWSRDRNESDILLMMSDATPEILRAF